MDIFFIDNQHGWAVGYCGQLVRTENGGETWQEQAIASDMLYSVEFVSQTHGFAGGIYGTVLETTDGGLTWNERTGICYVNIYDIDFVDTTHGWMVGNGSSAWDSHLYYTVDGGQSWDVVLLPHYFYCSAVEFADELNGCIFGDNEIMLKTTTGGLSWTTHSTGRDAGIRSAFLRPDGSGCAVGDNGRILRTSDVWETMEAISKGTADWFFDVGFANSEIGWVVGRTTELENTVMKTTDGGQTWEQRIFSSPNNGFSTVSVVSEQVIWIAGYSGEILRSSDGGRNWDDLSQNQSDRYRDSYFFDEWSGWIVGDGVIMHTVNGGVTWERSTSGDFFNLVAIDFVDESHGWIANSTEKVLVTTDGGENWSGFDLIPSNFIPFDIHFIDARQGWIVGYDNYSGDGTILYTSNGGSSWIEQLQTSEMGFRSIGFRDSRHGMIVGGGGIMTTADSGVTWNFEPCIAGETLRSVAIAGNEAWAVGYCGVILHMDGIVNTVPDDSPVVPRQFAVKAYPNPFNPETTIRIELDQPQRISLSVYNVTGRLVERLSDGMLPTGSYSFCFDASSLPSGNYFVQLRGSSQSAAVRLNLIK